MKKLQLILLCFPVIVFGQGWSNYYIDANLNHNINANINQNVNVSGNINKTITTIDYGALANANAIKEQNRLANLQYANEREKQVILAIANDPSKAYDYGTDNNWKLDRASKMDLGWKKPLKYMYHKIPHKSLFIRSGSTGYTYENISLDGITTQIIIYNIYNTKKVLEIYPDTNFNFEERFKYPDLKVGELNDLGASEEAFVHKKDIDRANIGGLDSFCGTLIWEDIYEKTITENYQVVGYINNESYLISIKVRYKGDTDEVNFEQLEGRRHYFKPFVKKLISTINVY